MVQWCYTLLTDADVLSLDVDENSISSHLQHFIFFSQLGEGGELAFKG